MRTFHIGLAIIFFFGGIVSAQSTTEQQTINPGFDGPDGWQVSFGTTASQVNFGNGILTVTGRGGAGQFFAVNQETNLQITTGTALKSSSWAAIGVTYYDAYWNEIQTDRQQVTADIRSGGVETRYTFNIDVPAEAVNAYLWVWNEDEAGFVEVNDLSALNYFPDSEPSDTGLITNGNFETEDGHGFWLVEEVDNSVRPENGGMIMGSANATNLMYQRVDGIEEGVYYTLEFEGGRTNYSGGVPYALYGIDFFDASGNRIDRVDRRDILNYVEGGDNVRTLNFRLTFGDVAYAYVWVWTQELGAADPVRVDSVKLYEYEPPVIEFPGFTLLDNGRIGFDIVFVDREGVDFDTLDDNDFSIVGPTGRRVVRRNPDPAGPLYIVDGVYTEADNGTQLLEYVPGEIADVLGNVAQEAFPGQNQNFGSPVIGSLFWTQN